jgi:hypothetical protein
LRGTGRGELVWRRVWPPDLTSLAPPSSAPHGGAVDLIWVYAADSSSTTTTINISPEEG